MADDQVRVWVVDDQPSFRRAAVATLATMDDFVFVGECDRGETAVEQIPAAGGVDLVLMDIHLPGIDGIEATRQICSAQADLMVVLMSTYDVEDLPSSTAHCGAATYLKKESLSPDSLRRLWRAGS